MGKRFVIIAALASIAAPAYASQAGAQESDSPSVSEAASMIALGAIAPEAPILSGAQGATGSGGHGILMSTLYGGLAGALVGFAVGLIEGGSYGRDVVIGAGVGILAGAALGAANAFGDRSGPYPAHDGMGSTDRAPAMRGHTLALAGIF